MYGNRDASLSVAYKQVDGLDIHLDAYIPKNKPEDHALDVMFYIHGGAMTAMDRTDVPRWLPKEAERRRAILVSPDYRLSPQAKIADSFADVADAFRWTFTKLETHLRTLGHLRLAERISRQAMAFGGSAGGWLCLLLGTVDHSWYLDKLRLGAIYPMTNLTDEHYTIPLDVPGSAPIERSSVQAYIDGPIVAGAPPDFDYETGAVTGRHRAALYMAQQAQWRAWILGSDSQEVLDQWDIRLRVQRQGSFPPTFLLHGADDTTILPSNSKDVANALADIGVHHRLHIISTDTFST
ncbi:alpha/beta-hydrolase [Acaromyces ingoldii]|uniref:Alpha/beta-hydrolase n=1 Tax=Acaromyces ingoldii TaxID=215250 RepID=A0A316YBS4_9BASI|nr:alpha/beta-hydrolase [Acaromyces ingoldii]PWN86709.1 alpha/beta-hydrolase [Acaromyces ingoldii]